MGIIDVILSLLKVENLILVKLIENPPQVIRRHIACFRDLP